jgi:hypothetical protein
MRVRDFLIEYDRNVTIQRWGDRMFLAYRNDQAFRPYERNRHSKQTALATIIRYLEDSDPTPNKQYVPTLAKWYSLGNFSIEDAASRGKDALTKFDLLKKRNRLEAKHRDIGRFRSWQDFENSMSLYVNFTDAETNKGKAKEVYSDKDLRIIIPFDQTAACYYGQGTRWCTAARNNNYFDNYNERGRLYIILPKKPIAQGEKYQFHFPSGQFMDETDAPANLYELATRFPVLREFFKDEANKHNIIDLLYDGLERVKVRHAKTQTFMKLYQHAGLKKKFSEAAIKTLSEAYHDSFRNIRSPISEEDYSKAVGHMIKIQLPNDITFVGLIGYLNLNKDANPDGFNSLAQFEDMMSEAVEELMRGNNSYANGVDVFIDRVRKEEDTDLSDMGMELWMEFQYGLVRRFSPPLYEVFMAIFRSILDSDTSETVAEGVVDATGRFQKRADIVKKEHGKEFVKKLTGLGAEIPHILDRQREMERAVSEELDRISQIPGKFFLKHRLEVAPLFKDYSKGASFLDVLEWEYDKFNSDGNDANKAIAIKFIREHLNEIFKLLQIQFKEMDELEKKLDTSKWAAPWRRYTRFETYKTSLARSLEFFKEFKELNQIQS